MHSISDSRMRQPVWIVGFFSLCGGIMLPDIALVACAAHAVSTAEAGAVILTYVLISAGLVFTLYEINF